MLLFIPKVLKNGMKLKSRKRIEGVIAEKKTASFPRDMTKRPIFEITGNFSENACFENTSKIFIWKAQGVPQ